MRYNLMIVGRGFTSTFFKRNTFKKTIIKNTCSGKRDIFPTCGKVEN